MGGAVSLGGEYPGRVAFAIIKTGCDFYFATIKMYSNGSFPAALNAGNSNRAFGLLRSAAKGVK